MRVLAGIAIMTLIAIPSYAQATKESKCKLQDLAVAAALGDPEAQHDLGVEFHRGVDVTQDFSRAATMWRLSSSAGIIPSHNNLGHLTYYGRGVKQDFAEGLRLWRIAAEKGFAESQYHIGHAYSDGKHLKQDHIEAYAWLTSAKHYAAKERDAAVLEMVEKRLTLVREWLTRDQVAEGEKRAVEYIAMYGPK